MVKPSPITTAFVIDDLGFGGAQRQLSILAEALSRSGRTFVFCLSESTRPYADKMREKGVDVVVVPRSHAFEIGRIRFLARAIEAMNIDIVHGFLDAANVYAWIAARLTGSPCVLSLRNERLRLEGLRKWVLCLALRRADFVIANSNAGLRFLTDGLSLAAHRVAVVPNAITAPSCTPTVTLPDPPVIGFVGRLDPQKQVGLLIDSFSLVAAAMPGSRLVMVGDGPERTRLVERVRELGIGDRVQFTGLVDDVERRMAGFSCLVLPSAYEGFPNVAMEAVAMGVPVVASAVGDVELIVKDGRTGYLLTKRSPRLLADLIVRAATDESLKRLAAEEGPALVRNNYSVDAAAGRLTAIYRDVLSQR